MTTAFLHPQPSDYRDRTMCAIYLSEDVMASASILPGDIVRLSTEQGRQAVARVVGRIEGDVSRLARVDRLLRQTLKAFPHEEMEVCPANLAPAPEVVLVSTVDLSMLHLPNLVPQVKALLAAQQVPLRIGMLVHVQLPESRTGITFNVHSVEGGEGVVTASTQLYVEFEHDHDHDGGSHHHEHAAGPEVVDTTFEDVGGLEEQVRAIRETVELPLIFPQVYRHLGISAPHGVIFFGAPGTGKTLLARCVANEINAGFFYINGPEVVGTFSGQTEENLRRIFGEAAFQTPAIIFIDELDAIAPARRTASTLSDARAVTQLLSLMDGLKRADGVIVIGTTNRIEAIDPALRRAGRFDREIYFGSPTPAARERILRIHTREMPLSDDALAALPEVAGEAYGYVGADLMELAREAGLNALRRAAGSLIEHPTAAGLARLSDLTVTATDLRGALRQTRPSALRESMLSFPSVGLEDVGGLSSQKHRLRELVAMPLVHPQLFAGAGLPTNLGVLLHGPSGNGKTLLARAIARETGVNFIAVRGPELFSQWFGESEEAVRDLFNLARRAAPCIVFFDQLDSIAPRRGDLEHEGTRAPQRIVNQIMVELDDMDPSSQVIVLGATNQLDVVDPSILRPGRFGVHIHVGPPNQADRVEILRVHLRDAWFSPEVHVETLIGSLAAEARSGAELAQLCQTAKLRALERGHFRESRPLEATDFDLGTPRASEEDNP